MVQRIVGGILLLGSAGLWWSVRPPFIRGDTPASVAPALVAAGVLLLAGATTRLSQGSIASRVLALSGLLFTGGAAVWLLDEAGLQHWRARYETAVVVVGSNDRLTPLGGDCLRDKGPDNILLVRCGAGVPADIWEPEQVRTRWLILQGLYILHSLAIHTALVVAALVMMRAQHGGKEQNSGVVHATLRVLFVVANPTDTPSLDLEEEVRSIEQELSAVRFRDQVTLKIVHAARSDDLVRRVREYSPNVIHFSGHGSDTGLLVRADGDQSRVVPGSGLARFLHGRDVKLVVLNACYSERHAREVIASVDAVVGTTSAVDDEAARRFSVAFYRALGNGHSVGDAFRDGRDAVSLHGLPDVFFCTGDMGLALVNATATAAATAGESL